MNRAALAIVVAVIVIIAAVGVVFLVTNNAKSSTQSSLTSNTSSTSSSSSGGYYFLVLTQKGMAQLESQSGSLLGYTRLYNISDSTPVQDFYWDEYPVQGIAGSTFLIPLNNGTVEILNITTMKIMNTISVGSATGFIGVAVNPNQTFAALADGPSGKVEVMDMKTLQVLWKTTFNTPSGSTAYPCDVRWSADGNSFAIPMKNNDTVDIINAQTGAIMASSILPTKSQPYMLSINTQGNQLAVELAGNKTDAFYSYPALKPLGTVGFNSSFTTQRGVFTADGKYYLEASSSSNVVAVISTSTFKQVNTINLPPSSAPGLSDMELTPDSNYAYVVQHGNPTSGGIIYLILTSNLESSEVGASASIPLTTAPAIAVPISVQTGTYLADQVLSPPVTGLHC
ncbi:MAG: YncE family protein [Nitrososphaerales archaeon]